MTDTEQKKAQKIIRNIGLALNACHNTVTTDDPSVEPDETSWRIDNSKEIYQLDDLAEMISVTVGVNNDSDLDTLIEKLEAVFRELHPRSGLDHSDRNDDGVNEVVLNIRIGTLKLTL